MHTVLRTDTAEIPPVQGASGDTTRELRAPWLRPPVVSTYRRPPTRVVRRAAALRRSPFARHLTAAGRGLVTASRWTALVVVIGVGAVSLVVGFPQVLVAALDSIGALP